MKSPLPTSFALLLLALGGVGIIMGLATLLHVTGIHATQSEEAQGQWGVFVLLVLLGTGVHSGLGVLAALRYRQERKVLNRLGLAGNALLLLGCLSLIGAAYWQTRPARFSQQLEGTVETVEERAE